MSSAPFNPLVVVHGPLAALVGVENGLQQIRGVADYAEITDIRSFRPPEGFVITTGERGQPNGNNARQVAKVSFSIVLAVQNYRYERGMAATSDAHPLIGTIRDLVIGWTPPVQGGRPCQWSDGRVLDYDAGTLLWADTFTTQHFIGKSP